MARNYLEVLLRPRMKTFSETEKIIAEAFISLGEEVVNKTLTSLAEEIGVSEASIFKFVKKIGFEGFQNFKISVAINSPKKNEPHQNLTAFSDISKNDSSYLIAQKLISANKELMENLLQSLEEKHLNEALELLYTSQTVHFIGQGGSSVIALDSYHKFLRTQLQCNYVFDYHMQLTTATKLSKKDCVFLFSHSGETIETIEVARLLKKNQVKMIALTGNADSELIKLADVSFVVYSKESAFRSETLTSRILYLTLIDILYVNVMYHHEKENKQSLENIRQALAITKVGG